MSSWGLVSCLLMKHIVSPPGMAWLSSTVTSRPYALDSIAAQLRPPIPLPMTTTSVACERSRAGLTAGACVCVAARGLQSEAQHVRRTLCAPEAVQRCSRQEDGDAMFVVNVGGTCGSLNGSNE